MSLTRRLFLGRLGLAAVAAPMAKTTRPLGRQLPHEAPAPGLPEIPVPPTPEERIAHAEASRPRHQPGTFYLYCSGEWQDLRPRYLPIHVGPYREAL